MDNELLENKIDELEMLSHKMSSNMDNFNLIKFFAGELSILSKEISSILIEKT